MKKRIVIVGGGYAGIRAAKECAARLDENPGITIQLIDKNPYHTLMTELHEAAGGRINPDGLRLPLKDIFRHDSVEIRIDEIQRMDFEDQVLYSAECQYPYDYLILATGSRPAFFGIQGVGSHSFKLWSYKDAVLLRDHIENCFLQAAQGKMATPEIQELLTFVIAGGGFTGVEMAGELGEWKKRLCFQYSIPRESVHLILVEALPDILPSLDPHLRKKCRKKLEKNGVSILTSSGIQEVNGQQILLNNGARLKGTLIWTAGIQGNPMYNNQPIDTDSRFRIQVNEFLQSNQHPQVFSAGDAMSAIVGEKPLPQVVETAVQSGETAAKNIIAMIQGKSLTPFHPTYHGTLISVGSFYAAARLSGIRISGFPAILAKHLVHLHHVWITGGWRPSMFYLYQQFWNRLFPNRSPILSKQVTQFADQEL